MPTKVMKKYAEDSGKSLEEVEKIWHETEAEADGRFDKRDEHYWAYVNIVVRRKLGLEKKQKEKEKEIRKNRKNKK